jgi:hypothetical protein
MLRLTPTFGSSQLSNALRLQCFLALMGQTVRPHVPDRKRLLRHCGRQVVFTRPETFWWRNYFSLSTAAERYIAQEIRDVARIAPGGLVIGWELPPSIKMWLDAAEIGYVDIRLSALRFASKCGLTLSSNSAAFAEDFERVFAPLAQAPAFLRAREAVAAAPAQGQRTLVVVGQTPFDASVMDPARGYDSLLHHRDRIVALARSYEKTIYRPHPLGSGLRLSDLAQAIPGLEQDSAASVYDHFRPGTAFCGLSSSVLEEAAFLGLAAHRLLEGTPLLAPCDRHQWPHCDVEKTFGVSLQRADGRPEDRIVRAVFSGMGGSAGYDFEARGPL